MSNNRLRDLSAPGQESELRLDRRGVSEDSDPRYSDRGVAGVDAFDARSGQDSRTVQDPELARAPELHRDIEASVRRSMAAPDLSSLFEKIDRAAAQMREGGRASVEGSIRWVAAAASLLFLCLAMCASTLVTVPQAETQGMPSARGNWRVSLAQAMGLSLATASAMVASGAKLRRGGRRSARRATGPRLSAWPERDFRVSGAAATHANPASVSVAGDETSPSADSAVPATTEIACGAVTAPAMMRFPARVSERSSSRADWSTSGFPVPARREFGGREDRARFRRRLLDPIAA